jgi:hypothetical protein
MSSLVETVVADLRAIFALRLNAVVVYGAHAMAPAPGTPLHTLARVTELTMADLDACARRARSWQKRGIAVPLIVAKDEFARALDAFPLEFGAILAAYRVAYGPDPFDGLAVQPADLRRACEVEARGFLLHLREGFIESEADPRAVSRLVAASAPALRALLVNLSALDGMSDASPSEYVQAKLGGAHGRSIAAVVGLIDSPVATLDAARSFGEYLAAAEALVAYVDRWTPHS